MPFCTNKFSIQFLFKKSYIILYIIICFNCNNDSEFLTDRILFLNNRSKSITICCIYEYSYLLQLICTNIWFNVKTLYFFYNTQ